MSQKLVILPTVVMREHLFFRVSGGPGLNFTEHRSVRVFFYRTSNGPGFPNCVIFPEFPV